MYQNEYIINQQKDEINNLNQKYNQVCHELNIYKDKNNQLTAQIKSFTNNKQ